MNERPNNKHPAPASLSLGDVYYVLFRRKWLILGGFGLGVVVAVAVYLAMPTLYFSEAKLLVRYVLESKSLPTPENNSVVKSPDERGADIMNSEVQILTSLDLAGSVAAGVGPEKILAPYGGGTNLLAAAAVIAHGLGVAVPRGSSVLQVRFQHPDPTVVQPVLDGLIRDYRERHVEIHRSVGVFDDFYARQKDELRVSLDQTEQRLNTLKTNAGIISLEDTRKALSDQLTHFQQDIYSAQAELAERTAALAEMEKFEAAKSKPQGFPPEKVEQYQAVCRRLDVLRKREEDLLVKYTEDSALVIAARSGIASAETEKKQLETQYPQLAGLYVPTTDSRGQAVDPTAELARVKALNIRIQVLETQLKAVLAEADKVDAVGSEITQLQREKELQEAKYRYYLASLDQIKSSEAMGPGKVSNINTIQAPSPPARDIGQKGKVALIALAVGALGSIALAFVLELFLDPRVKRPSDVEKKLHLPLFLVIPNLKRNGRARLLAGGGGTHEPSGAPAPVVSEPAGDAHPASDGLRLYHETLRDRLLFYFHARNMTHKPKLVGVTSCSRASGATTVAAGLAAALSETGEGNVLLVDMNLPGGAAHPFHNGKPGCGLQEVLEGGKREDAFVQDNLYLASATPPAGRSGGLLPRRFSDLMPKLKASDYDFIIFDLPPVSQTSATANLAGMLDMTFLVLEAEKTNREAAARATSKFAESQASVAAVLNKARSYVPAWLAPEI